MLIPPESAEVAESSLHPPWPGRKRASGNMEGKTYEVRTENTPSQAHCAATSMAFAHVTVTVMPIGFVFPATGMS